ncbi:hypothetical protein WJX79_004046 [Trebouxia sp. C0005]
MDRGRGRWTGAGRARGRRGARRGDGGGLVEGVPVGPRGSGRSVGHGELRVLTGAAWWGRHDGAGERGRHEASAKGGGRAAQSGGRGAREGGAR